MLKKLDIKRSSPRIDGKEDSIEKIFVGGLPLHIDSKTLIEYFEGFGNVLDTRLMMDKMTGASRGVAYITFDNSQTIREILEKQQKSGIRIGGKRVFLIDKVEIKYSRAKQLLKMDFQPPPLQKRVIEKIVKIRRYREHDSPYVLPDKLFVSTAIKCKFNKVNDEDELVPKWSFDRPLEEVRIINCDY
jgi:RNA recognition motif-containing protein